MLMRTGSVTAGRGMHDGHMDRRPRAHHKHARHGFSHDRMRGMDDEESHHYRFQHLEEVVGQLMSVAKDQNGCRCAENATRFAPRELAKTRAAFRHTAAQCPVPASEADVIPRYFPSVQGSLQSSLH